MIHEELLILTCSDGFFGQSLLAWQSMDVDRLSRRFSIHGYNVGVSSYEQIARSIKEVSPDIVVYSSTQKPGYKVFAEDVLLALQMKCCRLVPSFAMMRAHENKGFQELLKQLNGIHRVAGQYWSGWKDDTTTEQIGYPCVLKWPQGSRSHGVQLIKDRHELKARLGRREKLPLPTRVYAAAKKYLYPSKYNPAWYSLITPKQPFVIQEFISGLKFDYKIIVIGNLYFCLRRGVPAGDFRASGSGLREFVAPPAGLLDYCKALARKFDEPFIALDIAETESGFALIEFQGVHFGPYTVLKASSAYQFRSGEWRPIDGPFVLEDLYADAICETLRR